MRALVLVVIAAALAACGGSSSSKSNPNALGGTVGGRTFEVGDARVFSAATTTTPCSLPNPLGGGNIAIGVSGIKIDFTSYANICADYATAQCKLHANSQTVSIILARLNPLPPNTAPVLQPGTYTVQARPTVTIPDTNSSGLLTVAYAETLVTGAAPTCDPGTKPSVQGGTVRIDQVSDALVTGSVNLTFSDGSTTDTVVGDFSASNCPGVTFDICQIAQSQQFCTLPPTCQ